MTQHDNDPHFVYVLRDADGDAHYVGCSHDPTGRWEGHINALKGGSPFPLYAEMRYYALTFDDFYMEVISEWPDKKQGVAEENRLSKELRELGNALWQGRDGDEPTVETRAKQSAAKLGRKFTPERRVAMKIAQNRPETKAKKSARSKASPNIKRTPVVYDGTEYPSVQAASRLTGVAYLSVYRWSKSGRHGWRRS